MQRRIVDAGFVLCERKLALIQSAAHRAGLEVECRLEPIGLDTGFPVSLFGGFSRHVGALGVDERCSPALGHAHALGELFRHTIERVAADKAARKRLHQLTGQLVLVRPDAGRKLAAGPRRSENVQIYDIDIERNKSGEALHPSAIFSIRLNEKIPHTQLLSDLAELDCFCVIEEL